MSDSRRGRSLERSRGESDAITIKSTKTTINKVMLILARGRARRVRYASAGSRHDTARLVALAVVGLAWADPAWLNEILK